MILQRMRWFGVLALACAAAGSAGCSGSSCGKCGASPPYATRVVAPDEQTALGFSANDVKARLVGPWVGMLNWVADPAKVTAQPATGTTLTTIALRYDFDKRSIIAQEPSGTYTDASAPLLRLELPIHLLVTTADGALVEDHPAAIRATSVSQGTVLDAFGATRSTPVQGTYSASAVDTARYLGTDNQFKVELAPDTATVRLILLGIGSAKSADGKSDIKIYDELPVATFTGTATAVNAEVDSGVSI